MYPFKLEQWVRILIHDLLIFTLHEVEHVRQLTVDPELYLPASDHEMLTYCTFEMCYNANSLVHMPLAVHMPLMDIIIGEGVKAGMFFQAHG